MENILELKKRSVVIRTPDHRLRVFVSSTLNELAAERDAVHKAITRLRLAPVMFESGARPHPAQNVYQAYISQSHIFIGIYWQSYGWIAPEAEISGLEDEYNRSSNLPRLIYIKKPSPERDPALVKLLDRVREENGSSYKYFTAAEELGELVENDLILLLTEYFETARAEEHTQESLSATSLINVPIPRNPLIGREVELETAHNLLLQDEIALVTLTGPAGTGKSRLGIQIAIDMQDHFEDGVCMVLLETIHDPGLVIPSIAKELNITEAIGGLSLFDQLKGHLCRKHMLLLLDNFEHVLAAAPQASLLLEACPKMKILVTSRASLHIRPEKELPISPLKVPQYKETSVLQSLSQYSSVQLFVQRCQGVQADFNITPDNAPAIAEICQRLDGLPLAIELAAARIKLLPPKVLLSRLEHRFDVLRGGTKDLPERHKTMYSAIDWSYNLLKENEKQLFRRLSVFKGGWTLDAALVVCSAEHQGQLEVMDGLQILVDNNLLRSDEEAQGEPRLRMLETIREFAYKRLAERGESDINHHRHALYFASLAEQADWEKFGSSRQQAWRIRLETELDNLRAAMKWALEQGHYGCELRIATGLWRFWWVRGYWREGIQWLEQGLAGSEPSAGMVRARALARLGWMLHKVGDTPRAIASLQESVTLWRQIDNQAGLAMALSHLGGVMLAQDQSKATALLEEALKIRKRLNDQRGVDATLMNLGLASQRLGRTDKAIELFTESLSLAREVKDYYSMGITLVNLGDVHTNQGAYKRADGYYAEAERIYQNLGDRTGLADVKRGQGRIALKMGDYARAFNLLAEACSISYQLGVTTLTLASMEGIAFVAQKLDNPIKAIRLFSASDSIRNNIKLNRIPIYQAECEAYLSGIRTSLDETIFKAAWDDGRIMALDQAVAYAVKQGV